MTSAIRQNYNAECEGAINKQINVELYASYVYQSMVILTIFVPSNDYDRLKRVNSYI